MPSPTALVVRLHHLQRRHQLSRRTRQGRVPALDRPAPPPRWVGLHSRVVTRRSVSQADRATPSDRPAARDRNEEVLASGHALYLARPRRRIVALTSITRPGNRSLRADGSTGYRRLPPHERALEAADRCGARITLMAEMGEFLWLREHEPDLARRMEQQWAEALAGGHDVQLHLHPNWLPELGARRIGEHWVWDWSHALGAHYPGDLEHSRPLQANARSPVSLSLRATPRRVSGPPATTPSRSPGQCGASG